MAKGMGFAAAARSVARRIKPRAGETKAEAGRAVIAAGALNASAAAKRANPNLRKVRGK